MNRRQKRAKRWVNNNIFEPFWQLKQGRFGRYLGDRMILRFKIRPVKQIEGWLTPAEAATLYRTAAGLGANATIVEIGSWKGKSTYCLASGLPENGRVIAIDPFDGSGEPGSKNVYHRQQGKRPLLEQFEERMAGLGVSEKVEIWAGFSHEFIDRLPHIHFLFIDGDHSQAGCASDFDQYAPQLVPGGILGFHDYHPDRGQDWGPNWVIHQKVLPSKDYVPDYQVDTLWLARKL